ncbi:MAG: hypothetical protein EOM17_16040 [Synergistales bacterium]|nr:hypothetical protein [Synergistales bacterium]
MEQTTFRDYLLGVPRKKREAVIREQMQAYDAHLKAAAVPMPFVLTVGYGIRRESLMRKPVEEARNGSFRLVFANMDEDEIVRRYENSIQ